MRPSYSLLAGLLLFQGISPHPAHADPTQTIEWQKIETGLTTALNDVVFDQNKFIVVGPGSTILNMGSNGTGGLTQTRGTIASGLNLSVIVKGNSSVVTGTVGSAFYSSPEGVTWTDARSKPFSDSLGGVAYNSSLGTGFSNPPNGRWVAVRSADDVIKWADSIPGTWNTSVLASPNANERFYGVASLGLKGFVVVGKNGVIRTSGDGYDWGVPREYNIANPHLYAVTTGNNKVVAVGASGQILYSTDDGNHWTIVPQQLVSEDLNAITWTGSEFIAVGNEGVMIRSVDAVTWSFMGSVVNTNLLSVAYGTSGALRDTLIATGENGTVLWGQYKPNPTVGNLNLSKSPITTEINSTLNQVAYGKQRFVAVGENATVLTSYLGGGPSMIWNSMPPPQEVSGLNLKSVTFGNNKFLVGSQNSIVLGSSDGYLWRSEITPWPGTTYNIGAVAYNGGAFISAVEDYPAIKWAPDNLSAWTSSSYNGAALLDRWFGITKFGTDEFALCGKWGTIAISRDSGQTFTVSRSRTENTPEFFLKGITEGPDKLVSVGTDLDGVGGNIYWSKDGALDTWVRVKYLSDGPIANKLNDVVYVGNQYVAVGDGGTVLRSADGLNWQKVPVPSVVETKNLLGIAVGTIGTTEGVIAIVGQDGVILTNEPQGPVVAPPTVTQSHITINFMDELPTFSASAPSGAIIDWYDQPQGGTLLLFGSSEFTPTNRLTATYYAQSRNVRSVSATRTPVTLTLLPPQNLRFTPVTSNTTEKLNAVAFGGRSNIFVAGGANSTTIWSSLSDGNIRWFVDPIPPIPSTTDHTLFSVAYLKGVFMAGVVPASRFYASDETPFLTWTSQRVGSEQSAPKAFVYNSFLKRFVANTSLAVWYSDSISEPLEWRRYNPTQQFPIAESFTSLASMEQHGFIMCGAKGVVRASQDGITWTLVQTPLNNLPDKNAIAFANDLLIVVGSEGQVLSSDDYGVNWTERRRVVGQTLNAVAQVGQGFVAVGNQGLILYSADGITWTDKTDPAMTENLYGVSYALSGPMSGSIVVVGDHGTVLVSSFVNGNTAPTATAQSVETNEDTAKQITLSGTDPEQSPLTYSLVDSPAHGMITRTGANVTYTPALNYVGLDSFSFKVNDGTLDSAAALVSINVVSVNDAPLISGVSAVPDPVTQSSTQLSVQASDDSPETGLIYLWEPSGVNPGQVVFDATNNTNAGKNIQATFSAAGLHNLKVTVKDAGSLQVSRDMSVTVTQTLTGILVSPNGTSLETNQSIQLTAGAYDQFNRPMTPQPTFVWSVKGSGGFPPSGTVTPAGLYTAGNTVGAVEVEAAVGNIKGSAAIGISLPANTPPVVTEAAKSTPNPVTGTTAQLTVRASDDRGESNLTYDWDLVGVSPDVVTYSDDNTNTAKNTTVTFNKPGTYNFQVTIKDAGPLLVTSDVSVVVNSVLTSIVLVPDNAEVEINKTRQFLANGKDQFNQPYAITPTWSVTGGGNISNTGLLTAGGTPSNQTYNVTATVGNKMGIAVVRIIPTVVGPDTEKPRVGSFIIPRYSNSLTVLITTLEATDNVGVTGYNISELDQAPTSGWTTVPSVSMTFGFAGKKILYAYARDAAENISLRSTGAEVDVDLTPPVITSFLLPTTGTSLTVPITSLQVTEALGVAGYYVSESNIKPALDAAGWQVVKPVTYTFSSIGAKYLYAFVKDVAGNISEVEEAQTTITVRDTGIPRVTVFELPETASSLSVPIVNLVAVDDEDQVAGYYLTESNSVPSANDSGWTGSVPLSYRFTTSGTKQLKAYAKDRAGNVSAAKTASVEIKDGAAPNFVSIISPVGITPVSGDVGIQVVALDDFGVSKVDFFVGDQLIGTDSTPPTPFEFVWRTGITNNGNRTIRVVAQDQAGNKTEDSRIIRVKNSDTIPPANVRVTVPTNGAVINGLLTISGTATDNGVIEKLAFYVNNDLMAEDTSSPYVYNLATTVGDNGTYTCKVVAIDTEGNSTPSAEIGFTIANPEGDLEIPRIETFVLPATIHSLTVTMSITGEDNNGVTGYYVSESQGKPKAEAQGWSTTAPESYTFSSAGEKTLYAFAKDAAGNVSVAKSASVTITDNTPPDFVSISALLQRSPLTGITPIDVTARDDFGVSKVEFFVDDNYIGVDETPPSPFRWDWDASGLSNGIHVVKVVAFDAAGNTRATQMSVTKRATGSDSVRPEIKEFRLPSTAVELKVSIEIFEATDNVGVTGYYVSEASPIPFLNDSKWSLTIPTSYQFTSQGQKTLYAYAKDAGGNVSVVKSATVNILLPGGGNPNPISPATVKVSPNPFRPSLGHTQLSFNNMPADAQLKIYTPKGVLVEDGITTDPNGSASWTVPSSVASGTYIVVPNGQGKKKVIFTVIR